MANNEAIDMSTSGVIFGSLITQTGPRGPEGKTPKKGIDYYTDEDKQELIQIVTTEVNANIEPKEEERQNNETERINSENTRSDNELKRQNNETLRVNNEKLRQIKEIERENNEELRKNAESERENNETLRISNEKSRKNNEGLRDLKEQERVQEENNRQQRFEETINEIQDMTKEYNANAEQKTEEFNENSTEKITEFNVNALENTNIFDKNAQNKTEIFNTNVASKTNEFNANAEAKNEEFNTNAETKTNEFDANVEAKIEEFNENADAREQVLQVEIDNLEVEVNTLKRLAETELEDGTATGESITVNDSAEYYGKVGVGGNSFQATRSGKNIANVDAWLNDVFVKNDDGSYTLTRGETNRFAKEQIFKTPIPANTKLIVSVGSIETTSAYRLKIQFTFQCEDGTSLTTGMSDASYSQTVISDKVITKVCLYAESGDAIGTTYTYKDIMIRPVDTNDTYEEYGAMPSPEFPSEAEGVTGEQEIIHCGENLFDKDNINNVYGSATTITTLDTGLRLVSGDELSSAGSRYRLLIIGKTKNYLGKTIRIKTTTIPSSNLKSMILFGTCNKNGNVRNDLTGSGGVVGVTSDLNIEYTMPNEIGNMNEYLAIWLYTTSNTTIAIGDYMDYTNLIVTADNEDMTYKPYEGETINFTLPDVYHKLPNGVQDTIENVNGVWNRVQRVGEKIFNGNATPSNPTTNLFFIQFGTLKSISGLCNCFVNSNNENITGNSSANTLMKDGEFAIRSGDNKDRVYFKTTKFSTAEEFKNYFAENPISLYYELSEPIYTPLSEELQTVFNKLEQLSMKYGTNHIFTTGSGVKPILTLDYKKSGRIERNNMNTRITAIEELLSTTATSALLLENLETDLESEV